MATARSYSPVLDRILVVQTAYLGDVVLTTPLLAEIRRVHPRAQLTVVTTDTGRAVIECLPGIDAVLTLDKRWNRAGIESYARLGRRLVASRFDAAVAAQRSVRTGVILMLSGAGVRVGFRDAPGRVAYNRSVPWDPRAPAARRLLELSRPLGGHPERTSTIARLDVAPAARARAESVLRAAGIRTGVPLVCLAPGSARATKRWQPGGFARVAAACLRRGIEVAVVGSPGERALGNEIGRLSGAGVANLAGQTSLAELFGILGQASALVANDSGPAHVAAALGVPVVQVFGPTSPRDGFSASTATVVEHPGLACRPCSVRGPRRCPERHFRCMRELASAPVEEALFLALDAGVRASPQPRRVGVGPG